MLFEKAERLALNCFYIFFINVLGGWRQLDLYSTEWCSVLVQGMLENIGQYR